MSDRCQWRNDPEIGLWHLPGCWGAVVGGPECCYCGQDEDPISARLAALEATVARIADAIEALAPLPPASDSVDS